MNKPETLARNKIIRVFFHLAFLDLIISLIIFGYGVVTNTVTYNHVEYIFLYHYAVMMAVLPLLPCM